MQTEQPAEPETDETAEDADASAEEETPAEPEQPAEPALPDGVYTADFNTDSSMFHANEACDGKGTLTVENGEMTIHVSLAGTSILNLLPRRQGRRGKGRGRAAPAHHRHRYLFRRPL